MWTLQQVLMCWFLSIQSFLSRWHWVLVLWFLGIWWLFSRCSGSGARLSSAAPTSYTVVSSCCPAALVSLPRHHVIHWIVIVVVARWFLHCHCAIDLKISNWHWFRFHRYNACLHYWMSFRQRKNCTLPFHICVQFTAPKVWIGKVSFEWSIEGHRRRILSLVCTIRKK